MTMYLHYNSGSEVPCFGSGSDRVVDAQVSVFAPDRSRADARAPMNSGVCHGTHVHLSASPLWAAPVPSSVRVDEGRRCGDLSMGDE